jgi:ATP-dependent Lon protease
MSKHPNKKQVVESSSSSDDDYDSEDDDDYDSMDDDYDDDDDDDDDEYETVTEDDEQDEQVEQDDDDDDDDDEPVQKKGKKKPYNLRSSKNKEKAKEKEKGKGKSNKDQPVNIVFSLKRKKKSSGTSATAAASTECEDDDVSSVKSDELSEVDGFEYKEATDAPMQQLIQKYEECPDDSLVHSCLKAYAKKEHKKKLKVQKKEKKQRDKHKRIFRNCLYQGVGNKLTDVESFTTLTMEEQVFVIKELKSISSEIVLKNPYRISILQLPIPHKFKAAAFKKVTMLRNLEPGSGEYYKCRTWVDGFMKIPFGETRQLTITKADGIESSDAFITHAKETLDNAVFGMEDAKMQILQWLGQLITNPSSMGTSIAIQGPPGTGKTSLIKEGVSKILNRPFAFIALGGATDSSFLEGHGYTYEGSTYGKIVQTLIESKCMNPIFYFDELDKISETPKGDEISGVLTHLTDTSQNNEFHDKFFTELEFDLSKCLFIFSYNDESKVNAILRDRMYRIITKGYDNKQKTVISKQYLIPRIECQVKFESGDIQIPDETIQHILANYTSREEGVRNLKRCLEIIYTKLNLCRLLKPENSLRTLPPLSFPLIVTTDMVDKLIKREEMSSALFQMYI